MTEEPQTREEWLIERRSYLGATDTAAIAGMHKFATPFTTYQDKLGLSEPKPMSKQMKRGVRLEPMVADMYAEEAGYKIVKSAFVRHGTKDYIGVNPDYEVVNDDGVTVRFAELKTHDFFVKNEYGESGTDQVPAQEAIQVIQQMHVALSRPDLYPEPILESDVVVWGLDGADIIRIYPIRYDPDIAAICEGYNDSFWHDNILAQVPPDFTGADCEQEWVKAKFPTDSGTACYSTPEVDAWCERLKAVDANLKAVEAEQGELEVQIKAFMREAAILNWSGGDPITWKTKAKGNLAWSKVLAVLKPPQSLLDEHTGKPGRVFDKPWSRGK